MILHIYKPINTKSVRKNKLVVSIISIFILSVTLPVAFADVIEHGMKEVKFDYTISNIDKYPDYVFLIHGTPSPACVIINSSEFSFYKLSTVSIYSIKKSNFNETELSGNANFDNYFKNNPDIIKSNIKLDGSYKKVSINDPLEKAHVILDITSINGSAMTINKSKVIFTYTDGTYRKRHSKIKIQHLNLPINLIWLMNYGTLLFPF